MHAIFSDLPVFSRFFPMRFVLGCIHLAGWLAAIIMATPTTSAADLLWDFAPGTPGVQDGSGDWDTTNMNWLANPNGPNSNWTNSPVNNAIFGNGGFAGTVTVTESVSVGNITFNPLSVGNYLIIGAPITLSGTATITVNEDAQIGSPLSGTAGFAKSGAGTLTLSSVSDYLGGTKLNAGTLTLRGGNERLPVSTQLHFGGSASLQLNGVQQTIGDLVIDNGVTATVTGGGGTLTVTGSPNLRVGSTQAFNTTTLDLSGLGNFTFNNPVGVFDVGAQAAQDRATGVVNLATTNIIRASAVQVGNTAMGASLVKGIAQLNLGQTNQITAGTLSIGGVKNSGSMAFTPGVNNSSLTLRGTGASERMDVSIGISDAIAGDYGGDGLVDTRAGSLDAKVGTLVLGQNNDGTRSASGKLLMTAGTLDATSIVLGRRIASTTGAGTTDSMDRRRDQELRHKQRPRHY